ncbi:hypothetical protein OFM21_33985, partial [Escherichia coli]|nr:hypothetical protein [Escherichia coli]
RAAAQEKITGAGKPILAVVSINPSPGGIFPIPCPKARAIPANTRRSVKPALADRDKLLSPHTRSLPILLYFSFHCFIL